MEQQRRAEHDLAAPPGFVAGAEHHRRPLRISRDLAGDWLEALPHGFALDGQSSSHFLVVDAAFRYVRERPHGAVVGFCVRPFSRWFRENGHGAWSGPSFDVLELGLERASALTIASASYQRWRSRSTRDRLLFDAAVDARSGLEALQLWLELLAMGDGRAYFGAGVTLCELARYREAHGYLREYSRMVPDNAWTWCWLGRACEGRDDREGARQAYEAALRAERAGSFATTADRLLHGLAKREERRDRQMPAVART